MADHAPRTRPSKITSAPSRTRRPAFQEAPGEVQATAAQAAFLHGGTGERNLTTALAAAGPATRAQVVSRLQQQQGNVYVQRLLAVPPERDREAGSPMSDASAGLGAGAAPGPVVQRDPDDDREHLPNVFNQTLDKASDEDKIK